MAGSRRRTGGRRETTHPEVRRVVAGHFVEGPRYSTWRARGTDDWLLLLTVAGSGRVGAPGGELVTAAGDAVLIPPEVQHDYATAPGAAQWELAFAHFHPRAEWLPLLDWPTPRGAVGLVALGDELCRRVATELRRCARMGRGPLERAELFAVNALERALLWIDTQNPLAGRTDDRVLRIIDFVAGHLAEDLSVARLAAQVGLSSSRLSHLFAEQLGTSPQRYVELERMRLAEQLLELTSWPISRIAREVGWADPLYFSQRFRRYRGMTPSDFRRRG